MGGAWGRICSACPPLLLPHSFTHPPPKSSCRPLAIPQRFARKGGGGLGRGEGRRTRGVKGAEDTCVNPDSPPSRFLAPCHRPTPLSPWADFAHSTYVACSASPIFRLPEATAGAASTRLEQWQVALRSRLMAQSEIDLPARRQKLDEAAIPIERLQFGTARGELWSEGLVNDPGLESLLAHATDSILADYTAPTTVKNHALTLSARETEWTRAAKLYGQYDQQVAHKYQKVVMHTTVRVAEATCLMTLKECAGRPMKLKRILGTEQQELAASGWWEHVQVDLRSQVENATKWSRKLAAAV